MSQETSYEWNSWGPTSRVVKPNKVRVSVNGSDKLSLRVVFGREAVAMLGLTPGLHMNWGRGERNELALTVFERTSRLTRTVLADPKNGSLLVNFPARALGIYATSMPTDYLFDVVVDEVRTFLVVQDFRLPAPPVNNAENGETA